jgi:L-alanine-DL-glutamate epimerase-like enolase superfamily enzyme
MSTIQRVTVRHAPRSIWGHLAEREKTLPLVTPLDVYPEYQDTRGSWFWDSRMAVVEIETDDGVVGQGWCEDGVGAISRVIDGHLSRMMIGAEASDVEGLWDRMFRASLPYGRKGIALQAISAIDIALWDNLGRAANKPVYELLGGPVHPSIPVYASALHPVGHDKVAQEAKAYVAEGYQAMKMRFPFGPGDGVRGMAENEAHVANVRDAVGPDIEIMADAYMGWNFNYAKKMCNRLEEYNMAWVEEPFVPDDLNSYARLRQETSIPISGGEHEYTKYGFLDIIEKQAMDIIQPDLRRCGGFTEGRKISALAQAAGITVIPHAYGVTHIHFALADAAIPMVEYFPIPVWDDLPDSEIQPIFNGEPQPADGQVSIDPLPGLGVTVNEAIFD